VAPTTGSAGSSSGVALDLSLPQQGLASPSALRTADIRSATIRLPKGFSLNASVADGLAGCTEEEVGFAPDERQLVNIGASGAPAILVFGQSATVPIPELASAQEVQSRLEALPGVRPGDVTVSGRPGGPWTVDFGGSLRGRDVPPISGVHSALQRLVIKATGGTYALEFEGEATGPLPFDADAATVEAALEALPAIAPGGVTVSGGPQTGGAVFRIVFGGSRAWTEVPQITTTSSLAGPGSFAQTYVLAEGGGPVVTRTIEQGGSLRFDGAEVGCPEGSKIADGEVTTPLLPSPLRAGVYVASQGENPFDSRYGVYIVAEGDGTRLKLPGWLEIEPGSERIVARFEDLPQVPISNLELRFKDGNRGLMTTPERCGTYRTDWEITPWSQSTPVSGSSEFEIDEECVPEGRPLVFSAGSNSPNAGAFTSFAMRVARPRRSSPLRRIRVTAPAGLAATLAGVGRCPEGVADALTGASATDDLGGAAIACPNDSRIGSVVAGIGRGAPFYVEPGDLFLAGPYKDAPLSAVAVVPAIGGPFDLGELAVRIAIYVDPDTAQVTAVSDPLPTVVAGVPLELRDVGVNVDRPGFVINPTNCAEQIVGATIEKADESDVNLSQRFQIGSCADLGFAPRVRVGIDSGTGRNGHPRIAVRIIPGSGDAGIASATVSLPPGELLDVRRLRRLCPRRLSPEQCPSSTALGQARLWSPLLRAPLKGPIYVRAPSQGLPDLVAALHSGKFRILLRGHVGAHAGRLKVRLPALPDVPLSKAIVTLVGGRRGIVVNSASLCRRSGSATVALRAQSGRRVEFRPAIRLEGGRRRRGACGG
jgi:hypothetical protein